MKRVTVLLNRQEDEDERLAIFSRARSESAYQEGDKLEAVYTYEVEEDDEGRVLSQVFSDFNRGSPTFVGDEAYPQRSLSVGDVVEVEGFRWICESVGWRIEDFDERERRLTEHFAAHPLVNEGCTCEVDTGFRCYPEDNACECGCRKHHVHNMCGHIVQWG